VKAIDIINIKKRFPRTAGFKDLLPFRQRQWIQAVDGVNLEVEEGEFFGLLGPNGAGKTTLIKLLCCLVIPSSGTAQVFGHDILKEEQAVKNLVGLVSSEERSFFWRLTGRENLQFFASLYHLSGKAARQRINELLDLMDLTDRGDTRFQNYSTGMRQKLAIARGLLSNPKLLFVDEPTRSIDPISAQAIRHFLKENAASKGKTIVLATHNLTEAEQLCDRLAIMDQGRVIAVGTVRELRSLFQRHQEYGLEVRRLSESILPQLNQIEGVINCCVIDQQNGVSNVELKISNHSTVLPQVLQIMVQNGTEICGCQLRELPLEEIFIHALGGNGKDRKN
jgi:ABC-2 type transport system ATP-binding protein